MLLAQIRCSFLSGVYPEVPVWTFTPLTSMPEDEILSIFPPVSVYSIPSHPCFSSPIRCFINPFMDKGKGIWDSLPTLAHWSTPTVSDHRVDMQSVDSPKYILQDLFVLGLGMLCASINFSYVFEIIHAFQLFLEVANLILSRIQWLYFRYTSCKE